MKNLNQDKVNGSKRPCRAPSGKPSFSPAATALASLRPDYLFSEASLKTPGDPLQHSFGFRTSLDWIGDTMAPEVTPDYWACICRRESMYPEAGELVIGLLSTGSLVFGAHETIEPGFCRIAFINSKYPPVYYPEKLFRWFYPVEVLTLESNTQPRYVKIFKRLDFFVGES